MIKEKDICDTDPIFIKQIIFKNVQFIYNHIIIEDKGKRSTTNVQYRIPVGDQGVRAENVGGYERIDKKCPQ